MNYTYIVRCNDGSLYTGWTTDLDRRIETHNQGKGAKYTKSRLPVELVYYEEFDKESDARKREYAIKQLKRGGKLVLISSAQNKLSDNKNRLSADKNRLSDNKNKPSDNKNK